MSSEHYAAVYAIVVVVEHEEKSVNMNDPRRIVSVAETIVIQARRPQRRVESEARAEASAAPVAVAPPAARRTIVRYEASPLVVGDRVRLVNPGLVTRTLVLFILCAACVYFGVRR